MPQCEMCGEEVPSLTTVRIEGAEIDVCDECVDFGTEVRTESPSSTSTKYSTSSGSGGSSSTARSSSSRSPSSSSESRHDMFDEMDEIAQDYHHRIRNGRESLDLTQEELADQLNEKASLIRKLERGDTLPSDNVQSKLERKLEISLSESADMDDSEWEGGSAAGSYTLGDVVRRKD